jgi:PTH1 family peptidyl-tRNA hydrolase
MFLIVGLGNPGADYEKTRHNAGFMAVDEIALRYGFSPFREKFDGLLGEGKITGEKVMLLKPQTFVNLSGNSVVKAANFYKILPENIIVIHDDIDLQINQVKAKLGGGTGGHNGLKSIDSHISPQYNRVRIGVGPAAGENAVEHVLSRFAKSEEAMVLRNIDVVAESIGVLIKDGMEAYAGRLGMLLKEKNNGV